MLNIILWILFVVEVGIGMGLLLMFNFIVVVVFMVIIGKLFDGGISIVYLNLFV